jgi:hypothetical protein
VYRRFELPDAHSAQLAAFDAFVDGMVPALPSMEFVRLADDRGVAAGGYVGADSASLWFYNLSAFWDLPDSSVGDVSGHTVAINLDAGSYTVEFWNPARGEIIATTTIAAQDGGLTLTLPPFKRDLAVRVYSAISGTGSGHTAPLDTAYQRWSTAGDPFPVSLRPSHRVHSPGLHLQIQPERERPIGAEQVIGRQNRGWWRPGGLS